MPNPVETITPTDPSLPSPDQGVLFDKEHQTGADSQTRFDLEAIPLAALGKVFQDVGNRTYRSRRSERLDDRHEAVAAGLIESGFDSKQEALPIPDDPAGSVEYDPSNIDIKAMILDWDDTCQDTGDSWVTAHQEVMRKYGFADDAPEMDRHAILDQFGNTRFAINFGIDKFRKPEDLDENGQPFTDEQVADRVFDEVEVLAKEKLQDVRMDPKLKAALLELKAKGMHFAVWSSSPTGLLNRSIELNGLEGLFDAVISKDDVTDEKGVYRPKPDPYGGQLALEAMGKAMGLPGPLRAQNTVMVGDSFKDPESARRLHAHAIKIGHSLHDDHGYKKFWDADGEYRRAAMAYRDGKTSEPPEYRRVDYGPDRYSLATVRTYETHPDSTYYKPLPDIRTNEELIALITDPEQLKQKIQASMREKIRIRYGDNFFDRHEYMTREEQVAAEEKAKARRADPRKHVYIPPLVA
jgi:phosphoglycolate phosphatase-like HAD superfamily hydrolase